MSHPLVIQSYPLQFERVEYIDKIPSKYRVFPDCTNQIFSCFIQSRTFRCCQFRDDYFLLVTLNPNLMLAPILTLTRTLVPVASPSPERLANWYHRNVTSPKRPIPLLSLEVIRKRERKIHI